MIPTRPQARDQVRIAQLLGHLPGYLLRQGFRTVIRQGNGRLASPLRSRARPPGSTKGSVYKPKEVIDDTGGPFEPGPLRDCARPCALPGLSHSISCISALAGGCSSCRWRRRWNQNVRCPRTHLELFGHSPLGEAHQLDFSSPRSEPVLLASLMSIEPRHARGIHARRRAFHQVDCPR
jgi:hypothetical protein